MYGDVIVKCNDLTVYKHAHDSYKIDICLP